MISFFRYINFVLILCAITSCVSTKVYNRDRKDTTAILWNYHNRLLNIELEQIKSILEKRLEEFDKNQFKESEENNEKD